MKEKLRALGRRWPWLGRALDVQDRMGEINGGFAASAITVTVFISIFPLLLVVIAVVGYLAAGNDSLAPDLIKALGLSGPGAQTLTDALDKAAASRQAATVIGLVGLAWAGSAVAVALQQGVRIPWQERSNGIKDRLIGMAWLVGAFVGFALLMALSGVLGFLPDWAPAPVATLLSILFSTTIAAIFFAWVFWGLGTRRVGWRDLLPGALVAAVGFEILALVGTVYVPKLVSRSSALYGSIGVVFAILAWLALFARLLVYSSTLNAVLYEAREGTVEVPVHVPRLPGVDAVGATRGGVILTATDDAPAVPT
ncbi:YihY/virulence factor BrkB family protein [Aquihabitans sp. McL0605]|uniref:YihY/virulence factor BrkB family protein n=1 Tax=Aquihabitans sp. McL0605 TaxID=3415671 RepID=UPI003CEBB77C